MTVVGDSDRRFDNLSGSHHQSHVNCVSSVYGIYVSGQLTRDINSRGSTNQRHKYRKLMIHNSHDSDDDFFETSVNVTNNSPSWDYSHPDDQTTQTTETPGLKPFTVSFV